ncbi:SDR family NAD(P)-dependent oxidoreductase [Trinickia terrae]|uniref:SDR family NAD(P)-dependent oxidoreductase n=1 Tax=Trinickia terrae TaxID=2571161 RepID=A0A4U1IDD1_9BURK|nr:SDR family NAD(P)-dependent oxidoreductase [Trinickia terrae]TKC91666.1 SDR family NAD(P)-dependent oxidoreductase [Trinickia terrae]
MYQVPDQSGRRILITGANSGTGREVAKRLSAAGADVIMAMRTPSKGESARQDMLRSVPSAKLEVRTLDLADLHSVRNLAHALLDEGRPLDMLVNNAGVMTPPKRETTKDGFELQIGSNFLGPFALTNLLLPLLLKSRAPRVATMNGLRWFLIGDTHEASIPSTARTSDPVRLWSMTEAPTRTRVPA